MGYADGREAARGIAEWVAFYNERRPHQALADRTPMAVWRQAIADAKAVDMMDNAPALPTCPQPQQQTQPTRCVIKRNHERSCFQLRNRLKRSPCAGPSQFAVTFVAATWVSILFLRRTFPFLDP